jgi:hypothetical protein
MENSMKIKIEFLFLMILLLLSYTNTFGQYHDFLDEFSITEVNNKVKIDWVITSGRTCLGTKIYKSSDSVNFELIGSIEGICGSVYSRQPFSYYDEAPLKNKTSYYQLEFGGFGKSRILSLEVINTEGSDYLLYPNPLIAPTRLFIDNNNNDLLNFKLFNIQGIEINNMFTTGEYFTIDSDKLLVGQYYFFVYNSKNEIKARGKFQVQ